jgi:hypothetical protein
MKILVTKIAPLILRAAAGVVIAAGYYGPSVAADCHQECFSPGCGSDANTSPTNYCIAGNTSNGFECHDQPNASDCILEP